MADKDWSSFWDIGEPRKVLERIENGNRSCDELMTMIQERGDVELRYAKSLRQWAKKWEDALMKGSEYGSMLNSWRTVLQEASAVAKIHEDCRMRLTGDQGPFCNIYKWKNDHFHRGSFGGLQEIREAKDLFAAAQKEYAKLLLKVQSAKKAYYAASIAAYRARCFADDEALNKAVNPDARWKFRERADRLALERERLKQVYLRRVMVCNSTAREKYVEKMTSAFGRWQGFERKRLEQFKCQLRLFIRSVNTHTATGIQQVYRRIDDQVRCMEPASDVEEWGRRHGTGCQHNWPKYEETNPRTHRDAEAEPPYEHTHRGATLAATVDEMTDEFTTEEFDSELDTHTQHQRTHQHRSPPERDHTHRHTHEPYRSHQYYDDHSSRRGQDLHHRPPGLRYSQNEDLSDKWLEDHHRGSNWLEHGGGGGGIGRDGRNNHQRKYDQEDHQHHPKHHYLHHDHNPHHARQWTSSHNPYNEQINNLHKGHRSSEAYMPNADHHHRGESHFAHNNDARVPHYVDIIGVSSSGHDLDRDLGHDQGHTSSFYETLPTSHSQESFIHGSHTSSTILEQTNDEIGYHRNHGFHENSHSEDNFAVGQTGSSPEETYYNQHNRDKPKRGYLTQGPTQTVTQTPGQMASQTTAQIAQPSLAQQTPSMIPADTSQTHPEKTYQTPAQKIPAHTAVEQTPSQIPGQTPVETTAAKTYIERWDAAQEKTARLEQARQTLQPKEGERLGRALYDFKPATRDEMALKQGEFVVQIGQHLSNGWAYGRKASAKGHFPASYVH